MQIFNLFKSKGKGKIANIGIGLGSDRSQNLKIVQTIDNFLENNSSNIKLFGTPEVVTELLKEYIISKDNLELIKSQQPEKEIITYLKEHKINAIIRGNLNSSLFLKQLKTLLTVSEVNRIALLETIDGTQFFFGPVGIDECNDFHKKINFIERAIILFKDLQLEPKIGILSGGRLNDMGRDKYVDKTINIAKKVVNYFRQTYPKLNIQHDEILIEKLLLNESNLIIAPDGISGNLIYRTLVHLGGGKAYGAIYMGLNYIIIDTSRVGNMTEIEGALVLALALIEG